MIGELKAFALLVLILLLAVLGVAPALAQGARNCAPRDMVVERLEGRFGETRQTIGLGGGGQVVETYASLETGTWSIVITRADGLSCLVASGRSFELVAGSPAPIGDDT